jgi:hypothetical protein
MKSAFAFEMIIVVIRVLDLDGNMLDTLMVLEFMLNLLQGLEGGMRGDVSAASVLSRGKSPDVEVMDFMYTGTLLNGGLNLEIVDICGSGFHQSEKALFDSGVRGSDDDNCEDEGDKGISDLSLGPEPDDYSCNDDTN